MDSVIKLCVFLGLAVCFFALFVASFVSSWFAFISKELGEENIAITILCVYLGITILVYIIWSDSSTPLKEVVAAVMLFWPINERINNTMSRNLRGPNPLQWITVQHPFMHSIIPTIVMYSKASVDSDFECFWFSSMAPH